MSELGVCPASTESRVHGVNGGLNAGRACWAVVGTLCGGKVQGAFAAKAANCVMCEHYRTVAREEGDGLMNPTAILKKLV